LEAKLNLMNETLPSLEPKTGAFLHIVVIILIIIGIIKRPIIISVSTTTIRTQSFSRRGCRLLILND
jgi:hypothetical protein